MSRRHRNKPASTPPSIPNKPTTPERHPLAWLRPFIGPGFIIGGWGVISNSYIVGVCAIYFGLAVLFLEIALEPWIIQRASLPLHVSLMAVCIFFFDVFTIGFVVKPAPINLTAFTTNIDYSSSKNAPAAIAWEPFFTELDLIVTNPTDVMYDNVDLLVRPDFPVMKITQLSNLTDVSFEDNYGVNFRATAEEVGATAPSVPLEFLATNAGYKVHCQYIPPNSNFKLIMAVVDFKKPVEDKKPLGIRPGSTTLDKFATALTYNNKDGQFTYWYGSLSNKFLYSPKPTPKTVHVAISYTANYRARQSAQDLLVEDWGHR
jgi:hypothetical protein